MSLFHDAVYIAAAALGGGSVSDWPLALLLAFPGFAAWKFATGVLRPALDAVFTPTDAELEAAAAERARRDRARARAERGGKGKRRV